MTNDATGRVRKAWDGRADKWFEHRDAMLLRAGVIDRLTPFARNGGVVLSARCWCGLAVR